MKWLTAALLVFALNTTILSTLANPLRQSTVGSPGARAPIVSTNEALASLFDDIERALAAAAAHNSKVVTALLPNLAAASRQAAASNFAQAAKLLNLVIVSVLKTETDFPFPATAQSIVMRLRTLRSRLTSAVSRPSSSGNGWQLTWSDEFNGPELSNLACYDQNTTPIQCQEPYWGNHPCPTYHSGLDGLNKCRWSVMGLINWMNNGLGSVNAFTEKEVAVSGGQLILSAHAQNGPYNCGAALGGGFYTKQCPFLAGGLWGKPLGPVQGFQQLNGRFEVRARVPYAPGSWPAHWLLPTVGNWPDAGEIDIMEAVGWQPAHIGSNYHDGGPIGGGNLLVSDNGKDFDAANDAFATEYHVFAVEWNAQRLNYFVDGILYHSVLDGQTVQAPVVNSSGQVVGTQAWTVHVPTTAFHWVLNQTVANMNPQQGNPANPNASNFAPQVHYIDYVRVYQACTTGSLGCRQIPNQIPWKWLWGNGGVSKIGLWNMNSSDRYVVGDFDGSGIDKLLAVSTSGWVHLMKWNGSNWQWVWGNGGANKIALWNMKPSDQYYVGNFDGSGQSQLLAVSVDGWVHLMKWIGSNWQWVWGNGGANKIALWNMNPSDRYYIGDFDGSGQSQLLAVSANGWVHVMKWNGGNWQWVWGNGGANKIALWNMNPNDQYYVGDFDGDGRTELLSVATNGWSHLMKWNGSNWQWLWGNASNGRLQFRSLNPGAVLVPGGFYGDGKDALFVGDVNGTPRRAYLISGETVGTWQWMREDVGQMALWLLNPGDRFLRGNFQGLGRHDLLAIATSGWAHLMTLDE